MKKVDLDSVEHSMLQVGIDQQEVQKVIEDLKQQLEELEALKEKKPKVDKIKYIIANTLNFKGDVKTVPAVVVEAEDSVTWHSVVDEIVGAAKEANNDHKKFKKDPLKSVFDAVERIPSKFLKKRKIRVVSKTVTQILETDNSLS